MERPYRDEDLALPARLRKRITELETALEHSQAGVNEIRDDCELRMRIRAERIAELEATLKRKDAEIVARGEYVERLKARLAEYQDAEAIYKTKDVGQLVGEAESKWRPCWRYVRDPEWVGICGERVTKSDGGHGYCVLPPDPLKHPYNRHADVLPRDPHPPK